MTSCYYDNYQQYFYCVMKAKMLSIYFPVWANEVVDFLSTLINMYLLLIYTFGMETACTEI